MQYRTDIPGQVSETQLKAIASIAAALAPGSTVVEVGSLYGRSSWAWSQNAPAGSRIVCVDPWDGNSGLGATEDRLGISFGIEQFKVFTEGCENIETLKGYSPEVAAGWKDAVSVYYEDSVHQNPVLHRNMTFWSQFVPQQGIVCGDDYRPRFPDVINEVARLARERKSELIVLEFFWCLLPLENRTPVQQAVAQRLTELKADYALELANRKHAHTIELVGLRQKLRRGRNEAQVRLTNDSGFDWSRDDAALRMVALHLEPLEQSVVAPQVVIPLAPREYRFDLRETLDIEFELPAETVAGDYKPTVRLVGLDGKTLGPARRGCNQSTVRV